MVEEQWCKLRRIFPSWTHGAHELVLATAHSFSESSSHRKYMAHEQHTSYEVPQHMDHDICTGRSGNCPEKSLPSTTPFKNSPVVILNQVTCNTFLSDVASGTRIQRQRSLIAQRTLIRLISTVPQVCTCQFVYQAHLSLGCDYIQKLRFVA